MSPPGSFM